MNKKKVSYNTQVQFAIMAGKSDEAHDVISRTLAEMGNDALAFAKSYPFDDLPFVIVAMKVAVNALESMLGPNGKALADALYSISIRPEWCDLIVRGKKTIEVRKTRPKLETPFKVYIYCTKIPDWLRTVSHEWQRLDRKVIGEFICDKVWELAPLNRSPDDIEQQACMDRDAIVRYLRCKGWAWHISDLKIYDQPKSLSGFSRHDFRGMNGTDVCGNESCEHYQPSGSYMLPPTCAINGCCLSKPPQSWCYVAEAKEDDAL